MTDERLEAIEAREKKATPGPWGCTREPWGETTLWAPHSDGHDAKILLASVFSEDGTFIAHAREDIPALTAEVRRLQQANEQLCHVIRGVIDAHTRARTSRHGDENGDLWRSVEHAREALK